MTDVASTERGRSWTRVSLGVAVAGLAALAVLVARADGEATRHSVWRDPISWFGADEAPDPTPTRIALVVVGASLVVLAVGGWRAARPRSAVAAVAVGGALVVVIGVVPIECSMRMDFCEQLVRNRLVGGGHVVHAAAAAALLVLCGTVSVAAVWRRRDLVAAGVAVATLSAVAAILAVPTGGRVGPLQLVALAGGAWSAAALWRSGRGG